MASWVLTHTPWMPVTRLHTQSYLWTWSNLILSSTRTKRYLTSMALPLETHAMAALKHQMYPPFSPDTSIFEEPTTEYELYQRRTSDHLESQSPCAVLVDLVKANKFEDAQRVRAELLEMGVSIKRHPLYRRLVQNALNAEYDDPHEQISEFTRWWDLCPTANEGYARFVKDLCGKLLRQDVPNLPFIMYFVLLAVAKGFGDSVLPKLMPHIFQCVLPSVSTSFLDQVGEAMSTWQATSGVAGLTDIDPNARLAVWYDLAIRRYCARGYVDEAVQLLEIARTKNLALNQDTRNVLIKLRTRLNDAQKTKVVQDRRTAQDLATLLSNLEPVANPIINRGSLTHLNDTQNIEVVQDGRTAPGMTKAQDMAMAPNRTTLLSNPEPVANSIIDEGIMETPVLRTTSDIAQALILLKRGFRLHQYPAPSTLANFFQAYTSAGHSLALPLLRKRSKKAYGLSHSIWGFAEMLYHYRRQEFYLVLQVYREFFFMLDIPDRIFKQPPSLFQNSQARRLFTSGYPLYTKRYPSAYHTSIIWHIAAYSAETIEDLDYYYASLLQKVTEVPRKVDENGYSKPFSSIKIYDAGHFNGFVSEYIGRGELARATQVLRDMHRLGIDPNVHTMNSIVGRLAFAGDIERLDALVLQMEAMGSGQSTKNKSMADISTYTVAISSLTKARLFEEAVRYVERLFSRTNYARGSYEPADQALALLFSRLGGKYDPSDSEE